MSRLSSAILSSFLAAVLLSGCQGGSPGAVASETSSTTASPTASGSGTSVPAASVTPGVYKPADAKGKAQNVPIPVMPELAKENSKAGLEAFIGYWYATYSYATETGDLDPWIRSTDTTTESGAAYKKAIEANYTHGCWLVGGRISTPRIEVLWQTGAVSQMAKVQVIQDEILYLDVNAELRQQASEASNTAEAVRASFMNGAWQVVDNGLILGS